VEAVPRLIHTTVSLFFVGLGGDINTTVGVTTIVPIIVCEFFYLYSVVAPSADLHLSYCTSFSRLIWHIDRGHFSRTFAKMKAHQE